MATALELPIAEDLVIEYQRRGAVRLAGADIDGNPDRYDILQWDLAPGDALCFSFRTLHGAPGNSSPSRRRGFSARWVGDDVRFIERPGRTSPPFPDIDLADGDRLRNDWFPVIWSTP